MGEQVCLGSLVSFVTIDGRIDTIEPMGLSDRKLARRLYTPSGNTYIPKAGEMGLVVGGPEWPESGGVTVRLWHVLVGGGKWWFDEEHLLVSQDS